jgi:transcriptional regulator with XRE-family HTH domain
MFFGDDIIGWEEAMMARPTPLAAQRSARQIGENLRAWRILLELTAEQVAERAGVARSTIGRLERGEPTVGFDVVLTVAHALGVLDAIVAATDPYETPVGRARADERLPRRVRR